MKKISHKLTALLAGCFLGMAAIGILSLYFLNRTTEGIRQAESKARVDGDIYNSIIQSKDVLADVLPPPAYLIESYLVVLQFTEATDKAAQDRLGERLVRLRREFDGAQEHWKKALPPGNLKDAFLKAGEPAIKFYDLVEHQLLPAVANGDAAKARQLAGTVLLDEYNRQRTEVDKVVNHATEQSTAKSRELQDLLKTSEREFAASIKSATTLTIAGIVLVMLLVGFMGALISITITRALRRTTTTLVSGANQVSSAAGQVSSAGQSLAAGSSEQAASLEETSSSLEEMAGMTNRNAENATKANDLARQARQAADAGAGDMQAMSTAMNEIKTSSDDIAKIIKTIDEIAFQTNILALNAAVEAARAGEAGMGFAVVAEEVRNLAQRSAQAAKETAAKIEGAIGKAAQGVEISTKVAGSLAEIVDKVRQVDTLVAEVANASREQSQGVDQINAAVRQMDRVVQTNAAAAEESASAGQELNAQAIALHGAVGELLQLLEGSASGVRATSVAPATPASHQPFASAARPMSRNHAPVVSRPKNLVLAPPSRSGNQLVMPKVDLTARTSSASNVGQAGVDAIEKAIGAHGTWKNRLKSAIDTGKSDITPEVAATDDQCAFGK